jgi:hypothetical protein
MVGSGSGLCANPGGLERAVRRASRVAHPLARALVSPEGAPQYLRRAIDLHERGAELGSAANMALSDLAASDMLEQVAA